MCAEPYAAEMPRVLPLWRSQLSPLPVGHQDPFPLGREDKEEPAPVMPGQGENDLSRVDTVIHINLRTG